MSALKFKLAEAQTREAQIETALERVRSRTLAMQKSDELLDVSLELYNQFKQLDSTVRGLTINIINEKEGVFEVSFGMFNQSFKLSIDEQIVMSKAYKCGKSGKKSLVLELSREDLIKFNKIRNAAVGSEIFPLEYKSVFKLIMYMSFFSSGMLIVGMEEHRPEATTDILQRFASVFDLTYTRFLDLKKPEAPRDGKPRSIAVCGNAAELFPRLLALGLVPDLVTEQTAAHDPLVGYVPEGLSLEAAVELRKTDPAGYVARAKEGIAKEIRTMLAFLDRGAEVFDGNNIRTCAQEVGVAEAFGIPGFVPAYIRPQCCEGRGPFRWVALSGDPADIAETDRILLETIPDQPALRRWIEMAGERVAFQEKWVT